MFEDSDFYPYYLKSDILKGDSYHGKKQSEVFKQQQKFTNT